MSLPDHHSAASGGPAYLTVVETSRPSAAEIADLEPFAVEVQRRTHVTIVQPRGELDLATVETLRSTLDAAIAETLSATLDGMENGARLVLDLRGLSFIDSTGLRLMVALDQRARRDGFQLTLLAPAPPIDRAIQICGLDQTLPFAAPVDTVATQAILTRGSWKRGVEGCLVTSRPDRERRS
jgi:anti-sigma B factor antagonist